MIYGPDDKPIVPEYARAMTMTRRRLIVGAVAVTGTVAAQPTFPTITTGPHLNGRFWTTLLRAEDMKLLYVGGYLEGVATAVSFFTGGTTHATKAETDTVFAQLSPAHMGKNEIVSAVDRFFDQPENLNIPIQDALMIVALRAYGSPEAMIQQLITASRRSANEELDKEKSK